MTHHDLETWLDTYGRAWGTRDASLVVTLFSEDATYQETPFSEPMHGRAAIRDYWELKVVHTQEQVKFGYSILAVAEDTGIAHWQASFVRVKSKSKVNLDGVFLLTFDAANRCTTLREWWVRQETAG